ncbi:MAG: hypothetical protein ABIW82_14635 [Dokdonella sp.]
MKSRTQFQLVPILLFALGASCACAFATTEQVSSPSAPTDVLPISDLAPDPTFGSNGITTIDFNSVDVRHDIGLRVYPYSDGGYWIAGEHSGTGHGIDMAIAKTNADGSLDLSYNVTGKNTIPSTFSHLVDVIAGPPDRFYFVGTHVAAGFSDTDVEVDCIHIDGTVCEGFGTSGVAQVHFDLGSPGHRDDTPTRILWAGGWMYVLGSTDSGTGGSNLAAFVYKFSSVDGEPDPVFGNVPGHAGLFLHNADLVAGGADIAFDAVVYATTPLSTRVVLVGESQQAGTDVDGFVLSIDGTTGVPDGFIDDGVFVDLGPNPVDTLRRIIRRHDGGFVVAGYCEDDSGATPGTQLLMAAYGTDGLRDQAFGLPGGLGQLHLRIADLRNEPFALIEREDNRDLVVGLTMAESIADQHRFEGVLQLGSSGNMEHAFARVDLPGTPKWTEGRDLTLAPDYKVVTVGFRQWSMSSNDHDMVIARFNRNDSIFANDFEGWAVD